jgi:hypothetical protein
MRFAADSMLGKLARWLRLSGYDVTYLSEGLNDREILDLAAGEGRILLTRDSQLHRSAEKRWIKAVLIESNHLVKQLRQLVRCAGVKLQEAPLFSRCPLCNGEIAQAEEGLWRCAECGKVYWEGRHWENIRRTIEEVKDV